MKRLHIFWFLFLLLPSCSDSQSPPDQAEIFCEEQGGLIEMRTAATGLAYSACVFHSIIEYDDTTVEDSWACELWAFFNGACGEESVPPPSLMDDPVFTMGDSVIGMVDSILGRLKTTRYTNTGYVADIDAGTLYLDCSYWVKQVLTRTSPDHYDRLPKSSSSKTTALAKDYYDHFVALDPGDRYWERVPNISQARPGDIIAYKYDGLSSSGTTGHVMILYSTPQWSTCSDRNQHWVWVSDAARSGHGEDTRSGEGRFATTFSYTAENGSSGKPSGVGIGKMWFNTGSHYYYRWSSCAGSAHDATIAIGRLRDPDTE